MFEYEAEQKSYTISGVRIGGLPGRIPSVLIGSIFYTKDPLVKDPKNGDFNRAKTEALLDMLRDMSERTGLGTMLDVVATTPDAIGYYLRNLVDMTDFPLLIDGSDSVEVNSAGIRVAEEAGFLDRVILNSLTPDTKDELFDVVKTTGLQNALLLTFNTKSMISSTKRTELAGDLIQKAQDAGITTILIDTGVMDVLTLGIACKTMHNLKNMYGYPVGNGAHNAISLWRGLVPKFGQEAKTPALVGSSLMPVSLGADFVLIGPAKHASVIYPSVAMIDAALSGLLIEDRIQPEKPHPRFLIS
ncbi:MAG: tetrahydromethanopterin S-methyltransferase subunit H [Candidatus Thorarchaeota archaeon]